MAETISTYEQERRQKRDALREAGVDPYGRASKGVTPLASIKSSYRPEMGHDGGPVVKAAGAGGRRAALPPAVCRPVGESRRDAAAKAAHPHRRGGPPVHADARLHR